MNHRIEFRNVLDAEFTVLDSNYLATAYTLTNLTYGDLYYFKVGGERMRYSYYDLVD